MKDSHIIEVMNLKITVYIPYENYTSSKLIAIELYEDGGIIYHLVNNNNELFRMIKENCYR